MAEARRWIDGGAGANDLILDVEPVPYASRSTGRVLLADDNADMREHVARLLTAQGTRSRPRRTARRPLRQPAPGDPTCCSPT